MTAGARLDLCAITNGSTHGVFSEITGNYEFYSTDMANFPAGDYTFKITGTVGTKSAYITFVMTLVDPCPTTQLTINNPFVDQTYTLRDAEINQQWNIANILSRATAVDCGPITVNFFNDDALKSALDSSIFGDIRVTAGAF